MSTDELRAHLQHVAAQLGEHCNAVQILASVHADGGGTKAIKVGVGDWYSRRGLAMEFIEEDAAATLAHHLAPKINPPDPPEDWMKATGDF